jgi:hypothetical protein
MSNNLEWGLVANARSGDWYAELLQAEDGTWDFQIERLHVEVSLRVDGPSAIAAARQFLEGAADASKPRGHEFGRRPLTLIADDEFPGRVFVIVSSEGTSCRFTLGREEVAQLGRLLAELEREAGGAGD